VLTRGATKATSGDGREVLREVLHDQGQVRESPRHRNGEGGAWQGGSTKGGSQRRCGNGEQHRWPTCELVMVAVEGKTGEGAARCTDGGKRSGRGQTDNRSQPYIGAALRVVGAWLVRWNAH
jgi:hypothetical protein